MPPSHPISGSPTASDIVDGRKNRSSAVVGFTKALAEELRAGKVSVNAVCPGSVDTGMLQIGLPDARPDMSPDDIARTVLFLAHEAPAALTGACIDVFG